MQWEMCSAQERERRRHRARLMAATQALALPVSTITQTMRPVTLDLTEAARIQKETVFSVSVRNTLVNPVTLRRLKG